MDFFGTPIGARPDPFQVDELGRPLLRDYAGNVFMEPVPPSRAPVVPLTWEDAVTAPHRTGAGQGMRLGDVARALAQGVWDGVSAPGRAARGEPVTYGDAFGTALDAMGGGAAGAVPEGALAANSFRAYHGSPHAFDRFSLDAIGTGEGAQAYGHGLYFADSENVARGYSTLGARANVTPLPDGRLRVLVGPRDGEMTTVGDFTDGAEAFRAMEEARRNYSHMYEVAIHADPASFLDWDAPLSAQPGPVRDAITRWDPHLAEELSMPPEHVSSPTYGFDIVTGARRPERLSQQLNEVGIPGIRYLDNGSRGAGDGTRNTVVFDDRLIEILRRYGLAGAAPLGVMAAGEPPAPYASERNALAAYLEGIR